MTAYGVTGYHSDVDSEVYDAHKAYEIDKTKMKMFILLDMNGQTILNATLYLYTTWQWMFDQTHK